MNRIKLVVGIMLGLFLSACDNTRSITGTTPPPVTALSITGGGVKGPLANAVVTVYAFDSSQSGFKGSAIATAGTNASAAITGLSLPFPVTPPYIMEFTSTPGTTTDLTTGQFPVITVLRSVITQTLLDTGAQIYATPLTTMAVDIAVSNAADTNGTAGIQADEFESALVLAAAQVVSTLGFGLDSSVDIFDVPPVVDSTTDTTAEQANVAAYRAAVEAVTAIAFQISEQTAGTDTDAALGDLIQDLADGSIDGSTGGSINTNTLQILQQDPSTLPIPNSPTGQTVADVQAILVIEAATTAPATSVTDLDAGGTITTTPAPAETNPDIDGDGVLNADDAFPNDATESVDTDGDGVGNVADNDDDNDGVLDANDAFPLDSTEQLDTDGDGVGNNIDPDDDGDGVPDVTDDFPLDATKSNATDVDGDGWPTGQDANDNDPNIPGTTFIDTDGDGIGDTTDTDIDGDGVLNATDAFPLDATESVDTDGDNIGNNADTDDDGDGVLDVNDPFPLDNTETVDTDGDGIGNTADTDDDNDGVLDANDTGVNPVDGTTACSLLRDCDGDGVLDGADFNPRDAAVTFNFAPITSPDTVTVTEDAATFSIAVTANDTDNDGNPGDSVILTVIGTTSLGTAVINANQIDYTPNANATGVDTFNYLVTDGTIPTVSVTGSVTVTITAINDAPIISQAGPLTPSMNEDGIFTAPTVDAIDAEGDTLTWSNTAAASGIATVSGTGASPTTFTYVPNVNFNGTDSFDVTVSDGNGGNATITVDVTVIAINDAPVIAQTGPLTVSMDEDGSPTGFVAPNVTASDVDGNTLTWSTSLAANGTATVSGTGASPTSFAYVPNADFNGTDSFDVTVSDSNGGSATITVSVTVNAQNDAPILGQTGSLSVIMDEDSSPTAFAAPTVTASDIDGDTLTWTGSIATNGTVAVSGAGVSPTFTYVPTINFNGNDTFDVTVNDGNGGSATITVNVTINPQNDAPTITGTPVTTATENSAYSFAPVGADVDVGDTLTFSVTGKPAWATFSTVTGALTGTPAAGDVGTTFPNIIISVTDGTATTALTSFSIVVNAAAVNGAVWDQFNWDDGSTWQ